jgi:hypothetical protein
MAVSVSSITLLCHPNHPPFCRTRPSPTYRSFYRLPEQHQISRLSRNRHITRSSKADAMSRKKGELPALTQDALELLRTRELYKYVFRLALQPSREVSPTFEGTMSRRRRRLSSTRKRMPNAPQLRIVTKTSGLSLSVTAPYPPATLFSDLSFSSRKGY